MQKILLCFLLFPLFANAQIITTVAGNGFGSGSGAGGYSGDGGLAVNSELYWPENLAFDTLGNMYISDLYNNVIRKVTPAGVITTVAGNGFGAGTGTGGYSGDGGPATNAKLNAPYAVAVDHSGNLIIADCGNYLIRKVTPAGIISTLAGSTSGGYAGDGGPATAAKFVGPVDVFVDAVGNIFIADANNHRIRKINTSGIISTVAGSGSAGFSGDGGAATSAKLDHPSAVCTDLAGNIYITDYFNNCVRKVNTSGIISTIAGTTTAGYSGDGGPATGARLNGPDDISVDSVGNIYIADATNNCIREINTSGIIATVAGTSVAGFSGDCGPATAAQLNIPTGVTVTSTGTYYIADATNDRIRKVSASSSPVAIAIAASPGDTVCSGSAVSFTTLVTGAVGTGYQWYLDGIPGSTGSTFTYTPVNDDSVRCVLTSSTACATAGIVSSNTIIMTVNSAMTPTLTIAAPTAAVPGTLVTVTAAVSVSGSYNIKWFDRGVLFNTTTVPSVTYTKGTVTDTITAWIIPSVICYDSAMSAPIYVDVSGSNVTEKVDNNEQFSVYPNPAYDILNIAAGNATGQVGVLPVKAVFRLLSSVGTEVLRRYVQSSNTIIHIDHLPPGIYIMDISDQSTGYRQIGKIIKQ